MTNVYTRWGYWQYSDDIALVLPGGQEAGLEAEIFISDLGHRFIIVSNCFDVIVAQSSRDGLHRR